MDGFRCGIVLPFFDAADVAEAAAAAEAAGWAGVFLAETVWGVDAWVSLAAAAMRTSTIRLGTMLTPAARFKPWDLASRVGTVDRLSNGRVQLSVGLGALHPGWLAFERPTSRRERASLLDECLTIYDGLMQGQPFAFDGSHYIVRQCYFYPPEPPVQRPRPPVWVVGALVKETGAGGASLARAARWDGLIPNIVTEDGARAPDGPGELALLVDAVRALREAAGMPWEGYDVVVEGVTDGKDPAAAGIVNDFRAAGATWWIESDWSATPDADGVARIRGRIEAGPPV